MLRLEQVAVPESPGSQHTSFRMTPSSRLGRQGQGAHQVVDSLFAAVRDFCKMEAQLDDMTAIIVKAEFSPEL
jgi:hypothetical protein